MNKTPRAGSTKQALLVLLAFFLLLELMSYFRQ